MLQYVAVCCSVLQCVAVCCRSCLIMAQQPPGPKNTYTGFFLVCTRLLRLYTGLFLNIHMALLSIHRALLSMYKALETIYRALFEYVYGSFDFT